MHRRSAIVTAGALTLSVLSGTAALGAHFGALGLGHAPTASTPASAVVADAATTPKPAATHRNSGDDGRARTATASTTRTRGEVDD